MVVVCLEAETGPMCAPAARKQDNKNKAAHSLRRNYPDQVQRDFLSLHRSFLIYQSWRDGTGTPGADPHQ